MTATDRAAGGDPPPTISIPGEVREGTYGARVAAVEPGGAEFIPLAERHGRPLDLFWTWMSPNLEFATVFVGVISVLFFQQTLWQAVLGIVVGTGLGSLTQGVLSIRGPRYGVPQMVLSRIGFGYRGNILPAGINAVVAGIGWFAVNSVSGAFALSTLLHLPKLLSLVIVVVAQVVVAFFGHNLVHVFERYAFPLLAVAFLLATVYSLAKADPGAARGGGGLGGFLLTVGAAFGYAAGWNPYAADYTRYLPTDSNRRAVAVWPALGVFISCVLLEVAGAASATIATTNDNPTAAFTGHLPTVVADLTLLAIAVGAVSANVLNIYSGAMSFLALGIRLPLSARRAIVAIAFGVIGFFLAWSGMHDAGKKYEGFLLVISYWIGPWLGVYLTDWYLRRGHRVDGFLFDRRHNPWAGAAAMAIGMGLSIWLFSNQPGTYVGLVPNHHPAFGDITFEVGFLVAALCYALFFRLQHDRTDEEMLIQPAGR